MIIQETKIKIKIKVQDIKTTPLKTLIILEIKIITIIKITVRIEIYQEIIKINTQEITRTIKINPPLIISEIKIKAQ